MRINFIGYKAAGRLRILGASDCRKTSLKKINGVWGEAPSKVAGAAAPDNKPLPEGKGFGDGVIELMH